MKDIIKEQAAVFGALSDPTRLRLLTLLCQQREPDALCVTAMVGILGVSQPAISQHMRVLKSVGLVKGERRGNRVHYVVVPDVLERYQGLLSKTLNSGKQREDPCQNCDKNK